MKNQPRQNLTLIFILIFILTSLSITRYSSLSPSTTQLSIASGVTVTYSGNTITWASLLEADRLQVYSDRAQFTNPRIGSEDQGLSTVGLYIENLNAIVDYFKIEDKTKIRLTGTSGNKGNLTYYYDTTVPPYIRLDIGTSSYTVESSSYLSSLSDLMSSGLPAVYHDPANAYIKIRIEISDASSTLFIGLTSTTSSGGGESGGVTTPAFPIIPIIPITPVIPFPIPPSDFTPLLYNFLTVSMTLGGILAFILIIREVKRKGKKHPAKRWVKKPSKVKWKKGKELTKF